MQYPLLGKEIICAAYGLPGTGKLAKGIAQALRKSSGNTVIMKHHGALCFGINEEEAFMAATQLEEACEAVIAARYLQMKPDIVYDPAKMREFALINMSEKEKNSNLTIRPPYCSSERTKEGFKLLLPEGKSLSIRNGDLPDSLPEDAVIHQEIYQSNQKINYILHSDTPYTHTISCAERILYPLVDDFAQLVGTSVRNINRDSPLKTTALKKSSAVFIKNSGAFCCGNTKGDALAVSMILEKNCKAYTAGILFGGTKPISLLDRNLMRFVYLKKYSRQMNSAV
jgi:L-fuculose-phosphate aldolase